MRSLTLRFSASEVSVTLTRFGRKRRLVLLLAWLTLWPLWTALPVSSHSRDIFHVPYRSKLEPKRYARNVLARGILRRPYGKSRASIVTFAGSVKPGGGRLDFHKAAELRPYGTKLKRFEAAGCVRILKFAGVWHRALSEFQNSDTSNLLSPGVVCFRSS